ncbi:MAG: acetate/propionate family kinase [Phycisphaerae bacterium]|nr:acetate/propionate family kinase [Phycisphaerae bacterium]
MRILALNCGSSSLKYRLIAMPEEVELAGGEAQRLGTRTADTSSIVHRAEGREQSLREPMSDHAAAFARVVNLLSRDHLEPDALGHRVVHGGHRFRAPVRVDQHVIDELDGLSDLAPLHNPPAVGLIRECRVSHPSLRQVVVFDTAFHATIPDYARTYTLPRDLARRHGLHKYGFHGTSHQYVTEEAARFLARSSSDLNLVSCHLGSGGASLCAVVRGRSRDNTMGYSPLQGLMMSTRCGDLDSAVTLALLSHACGDSDIVDRLLNTRSGVLGMSGVSSDIRDVLSRLTPAGDGDPRSRRTLEAYLWRIRKYLGSYLAVTAPTDAVVFTDTIGEQVHAVRQAVCSGMEAFGLEIDPVLNRSLKALPADVSAKRSRTRILVIATNEELAIARRTFTALTDSTRSAPKTKGPT